MAIRAERRPLLISLLLKPSHTQSRDHPPHYYSAPLSALLIVLPKPAVPFTTMHDMFGTARLTQLLLPSSSSSSINTTHSLAETARPTLLLPPLNGLAGTARLTLDDLSVTARLALDDLSDPVRLTVSGCVLSGAGGGGGGGMLAPWST